jgi:Ca2+/H+ antiporter
MEGTTVKTVLKIVLGMILGSVLLIVGCAALIGGARRAATTTRSE